MQKTKPTRITHTEWFFLCDNICMLNVIVGVAARIVSNSWLNIFQKKLTLIGVRPSVVNFHTYLGLSLPSIILIPNCYVGFSSELAFNTLVMGLLGALGNYYIVKSLSYGEVSSIAPINSYKPVVALLLGFFYLKEIPSVSALLGIILIIAGTYFIYSSKNNVNAKAILYRVLALIFSGTEAIFIKKVILLSNITFAFVLWSIAGLAAASLFIIKYRHFLKPVSIKYQLCLILSVAIMQYTTNYVFSKINVSYALALFQLSTLLSVYLGVNIFHEKGLRRKILASVVMIIGAAIIIIF